VSGALAFATDKNRGAFLNEIRPTIVEITPTHKNSMWRTPNARFELMALIAVALLSPQFLAASAVYPNFNSTAGLVLQGYARPVEGKLRIVPAIGGQGRGGVWLDAKQPVENGFDTTFQIRITDKYVYGADGLAFVIQNPAPELGAAGRNIGYGGLTNLLVIKFDDYHWQDHNFVAFDEIAVLAAASPTTPLWDGAADDIASVVKGVVFSDGQVHTVRIVYAPNNLQVFLDDPDNPRMTVHVNLAKVMNLDDGRAWVGFTAASGADWQNHDLVSWAFDSSADVTQPDGTYSSSPRQIANPVPLPSPSVYPGQNTSAPPTTPLAIDPSFGYRLPDGVGPANPIETSTNLVEWTPLTNAVFYFRDPESTNYSQRFYRFPKN
jgi:Bacterial lectin